MNKRDLLQEIEDMEKRNLQLQKQVHKTTEGLDNLKKEALVSRKFNALKKTFLQGISNEKLKSFAKKPYVTFPQGKNSVFVAVPKFVENFQVGWLHKETESYYIFEVNQYSRWLGDVPEEFISEMSFPELKGVYVENNQLFYDERLKPLIKQKLGKHIKNVQDTTAFVLKGHEFELISDLVKNGNLPFKPQPVSDKDLSKNKSSIELRPYQKEVVKKFMEVGAVGVFYPTGAGKSFVAMHVINSIKGKKLIIVPTKTLVEQWGYYVDTHIPHEKPNLYISTYQGFRDTGEEYTLGVFDECQKLPANTFSRLALLKMKYRLGLSASPHREDGRESYIFALTGFPMGLDWPKYLKEVNREFHEITVHVTRGGAYKHKKVQALIDWSKKTIIFCDGIAQGKALSSLLGVPFLYGDTTDRLAAVQNNTVFIASRVMDLGVSIKDLQRIIEVDFLYGSRQQELQRTGRLMHSFKAERHDIIMTEEEYRQYSKRLWALQEKGFKVKVE